MTLSEAWQKFARFKLSGVKSGKNDIVRWNRHVQPYFGDCHLSEITVFRLDKFHRHLSEKNLSPQTIKHILGLVRRVFRQMVKWELYNGRIPLFEMPKFDNKSIRFLSKDEVAELLTEVKRRSIIWHDISVLALNTGCRSGELLRLTNNLVNIQSQCIYVMDSKNGKSRTVPLNKNSIFVVKKYLNPKKNYLFTYSNRRIKRVSPTFRRSVHKLGFNDGVTDRRLRVTFHTLRHTAASWMIQNGVDLQIVSQILGHSSLEVTKRYAHLAPQQSLAAVQAIENMFNI